MSRTGITGSGDGWVEWTTVDDGWSYNPSLACGTFLIVLGEGTMWGASSDGHGCATVVDLAGNDEYIEAELDELDFSWSMAGVVDAVRTIAERMDHPFPDNVVEAARELWFALLQEGANK